jgi:hypothetical protein
VLASSLGLSPDALVEELTSRAEFLASLSGRGICEPPAVAAALLDYPSLPVEGATA